MRAGFALLGVLTWAPGSLGAQSPADVVPWLRPRVTLEVARWQPTDAPRPSAARHPIRVGTFLVPLRVLALPVLPGQRVAIRPAETAAASELEVVSQTGPLRRRGRDGWEWTAPTAPGFYPVRVLPAPGDTVDLTFIVLRRAAETRDGRLRGYPIGAYRPRPRSMSARYEPPAGFIEAGVGDHDILVSPNFRLGQLLCKEPGSVRYLLVSARLLVKLEALLEAVNHAGHATPSLTIMSGFRTPAYNRAIGNTTDFSRHLWGDAADVYVDVDGDGQMDDLDGDGRSSVADARWLTRLMEALMADPNRRLEPGGLSTYGRSAAHGPFVHIDARGTRARW